MRQLLLYYFGDWLLMIAYQEPSHHKVIYLVELYKILQIWFKSQSTIKCVCVLMRHLWVRLSVKEK